MGELPNLFKLWPWVDLDPFYAKVKFGHIGFCMGKSKTCLFFWNHCSLGSQSCMKHSGKWVNEVEWVSKVKVILWPWSKVTQISMVKLVFLKNSLAIWNQSAYESLRENRNENLYKISGITWPTWPPYPYMVKTLKKSSTQEPIDQWPWNLVCSIVYGSTAKVVQIMTLVDLDPFYAKVKFGHIGFLWEEVKIIYFLETIVALALKGAWSI